MLFRLHSPTTLFHFLSVLALSIGATSALAQKPGAISLTQVAPTALRLRIDNPTALLGSVQVVRLSSGQTLFAETFTTPAYGHRFDFNQVPSGRYLVWLQTGGQVHRCLVQVQTRNQGSAIQRIRLASSTMPTDVVVSAWRSASGSGAVAPAVALSPTNSPQSPQGSIPNQ